MSWTIRVEKTAFRSFCTAKNLRRSDEKVDVIKFSTFRRICFDQLKDCFEYIYDIIQKIVFECNLQKNDSTS